MLSSEYLYLSDTGTTYKNYRTLSHTIDYREDFIQGFEVPILVLFCSSVTGPHNESVFSRCKSKLIVICNEEQANTIVAQSEQGARAIDVYG
jgi:hypothetical protein